MYQKNWDRLLHGFLHKASLAAALLFPLVTNEVSKGIGVNQQGGQLSQKPRSLAGRGSGRSMGLNDWFMADMVSFEPFGHCIRLYRKQLRISKRIVQNLANIKNSRLQ